MEDAPRPTPRKLADFDVVRRLGAGGMAEVFLAKKRGAEGTQVRQPCGKDSLTSSRS